MRQLATPVPLLSCLFLLVLLTPVELQAKQYTLEDLPRNNNRPLEELPGLDSIYDVLVTGDGTRLRTILTKPEGHDGPLPGILFVQWLSCDTIELPASSTDGWSNMLRRVARESGLVMMRTEKRGVGDSEGGPCSELDYLTELSDHRDALGAMKHSRFVDPSRIVIFGASMGGNYAPLVAMDQPVAGVVVWGGGAKTWYERMLVFERQRRELSGVPGDELTKEMKLLTAFLFEYLVRQNTPRMIAEEDPVLGAAWSRIGGTRGHKHYGRPIAFHHQAQQQDWAAAWERINAPVLVLYGEYDWFEEAASHALIARIVNRDAPGSARFHVIPKTDHHFSIFARPEDAVGNGQGVVSEGPAVAEILSWLREVIGETD